MSEDFGIDPVIVSDVNASVPNFSPENLGTKNDMQLHFSQNKGGTLAYVSN